MANKTKTDVVAALLVAMALTLAACQTPGQTPGAGKVSGSVDSPNPVDTGAESSGPAKKARVSKEFYSVFFGRPDHLKDLIKAGKFAEAAQLYAEQKDYFDQHMSRDRPLLKQVADHFHGLHGDALATALRDLREETDWPGSAETWATKKERLAHARAALDSYPQYVLLQLADFHDPAKEELEAEVGRDHAACDQGAAAAFAGFDHFGPTPFFDAYPLQLDAKTFMATHFPAVAPRLSAAGPDQLLRFAANYRDQLAGTARWGEVGDAYLATALAGRGGKNGPGLVQVLDALRDTQKAGFAPTRVPGVEFAFIDVTSRTLLQERQVEFAPQVDVDLPLAASRADLDEALSADAGAADFLIVFDVALARTERRVTKIQRMPARVLVGYKEEANPEYRQAQNQVNQAQINFQSASINQVSADSQFCYGMGCVAKAFGSLVAAAARQGAEKSCNRP